MNVDIVISVYGSYNIVARCLKALKATLPTDPGIHTLIIDDATPKDRWEGRDEAHAFADQSGYDWKTLPKNRGFASANNYGVGKGKSDYVCLLNSDTEARPKWIEAMARVLDNNLAVGLVGAKLIFPPHVENDPRRPAGRIQHAGVAFNADRMPFHIFMGWPPAHPKVNRYLKMRAMTGACWLLRRGIYEELNGLDAAYGAGNFEDVDFALKMRDRWKIVYCPEAALWHYTSGSDNTSAIAKNVQLFRMRWEDQIEPDDHYYW